MLRVGKMADYALLIMDALGGNPSDIMSMESVSEKTGLSISTVRKLMRVLVQSGLVRSTRGAKGGYHIARLPELINLAQILEAVEGPVAITECCDEDASCELSGDCVMESHWGVINGFILRMLNVVSLADLKRQQQEPTLNLQAIVQRLQVADRDEIGSDETGSDENEYRAVSGVN